jgi:hypothetical protein
MATHASALGVLPLGLLSAAVPLPRLPALLAGLAPLLLGLPRFASSSPALVLAGDVGLSVAIGGSVISVAPLPSAAPIRCLLFVPSLPALLGSGLNGRLSPFAAPSVVEGADGCAEPKLLLTGAGVGAEGGACDEVEGGAWMRGRDDASPMSASATPSS